MDVRTKNSPPIAQQPDSPQPDAVRLPVVLLAVACGLAIGNLYWAQPLLAQIAGDLHIALADAGYLVTATQVGYALGILLLVPLGDHLQRRRMLPIMMLLCVAALAGCAIAPSFAFLAMALACMGLTTVSGQIIVPMVGDLASPSERGKLVGIVSSGAVTGILLSRALSGVVAAAFGWRIVYAGAAVLNLVVALLLARFVPRTPERAHVPYGKLIGSVFTGAVRTPHLLPILAMNALAFGTFNIFWNSVTFLLSSAPFGFTTLQIGLVSLAGLTGAVASQGAGRLLDHGKGMPAIGLFMALGIVSYLVGLLVESSLLLLLVVAMVNAVAVQAVATLDQTTIFSLSDDARSRLNTAFIVCNFAFGAIGSASSSMLWPVGGWAAEMLCSIMWMAIAFAIWLGLRKALGNPNADDEAPSRG